MPTLKLLLGYFLFVLVLYVYLLRDDITHWLDRSSREANALQTTLEQKGRLRHLHEMCANQTILDNVVYKVKHSGKRIFYSEQYNFSYCQVLKAGSTFWLQAIIALAEDDEHVGAVFGKDRWALHYEGREFFSIPMEFNQQHNIRTVLVGRNPFARLYSGYVDKIFVYETAKAVAATESGKYLGLNCSDITFQQFLDFIVREVMTGKKLDPHWVPISTICSPCQMNTYVLVKQESFSRDAEYALQQLGVRGFKHDILIKALSDSRADLSIPGIIANYIRWFGEIKDCCNGTTLAKKAWESFKIQGFLDENTDFPETEINESNALNSTYMSSVVLDAIKRQANDPVRSSRQRESYLTRAYKSIRKDTIQSIQRIYYHDFVLFGYSFKPPTGLK